MNGPGAALGWIGLATGLAGMIAYIVILVRKPDVVRMLNGSGLLFTSLALTQARIMTGAAQGSAAFAVQASVVLLVLAVGAQVLAALRNRRAWDGVERRQGRVWDGLGRRNGAAGEERA